MKIRISKYFYVDSLVVLVIFFAYCIGRLKNLMILYTAVMLHESAHYVACRVLKEKVSELRFTVYGVNLRITDVINPVHSMIISAAGPVMSFFLICFFGGFSSPDMNIFKVSNWAVLILNIFPALPLDGGVFFKNVMAYRLGYVRAHKYAVDMTRFVAVIFAFFGIIFLLLSKYNISLLVISAFLVYNLREEKKYLFFLRRMIFTKEFDSGEKTLLIRHRAVTSGVTAMRLTECFGYNFICHFFVYDEEMRLLGTLTQAEIVDGILACGTDVSVGRLVGGKNEH